MRRAALATAVLTTALTVLAISSSPAAAPVFWKNYRHPVAIEPTRIDINYSTGFAWVAKLSEWKGWGSERASSEGVAHVNTCIPFCAAGNYKAYSATVTLYKVRSCGNQRRYLDVQLEIRGKPPTAWGSDCRGAQIVSP
jgi:hypothetical protein